MFRWDFLFARSPDAHKEHYDDDYDGDYYYYYYVLHARNIFNNQIIALFKFGLKKFLSTGGQNDTWLVSQS